MSLLQKFKAITTFVLDVDGVLTDGTVLLQNDGELLRKMNIKDGYAMQLAIKKGYRILVISGGASVAVEQRLLNLGIQDIFMQVDDKLLVYENYCARFSIDSSAVLFMGDDMPDHRLMQAVGVGCAPADAVPEIKQVAQYISPFNGGYGCVREVIEKVLKLRGDWTITTGIASR
jgi:3-deoxy-D-manno-octulosonate 8-phosphate phosphatase (KDO 8-P phosphatase)